MSTFGLLEDKELRISGRQAMNSPPASATVGGKLAELPDGRKKKIELLRTKSSKYLENMGGSILHVVLPTNLLLPKSTCYYCNTRFI